VAELQTPEYALRNGELIPWNDAVLHVGCEAVNRGLNVFEGIKGYWQASDRFVFLEMRRHYDRLLDSARLLHIPCPWAFEEFQESIFRLVNALISTDQDMWVRTTLFVTEGHWGENTKADLIMTAYHSTMDLPAAINLGISTWQRSTDASLPPRIKTPANYQMARLARIEGRSRDCEDMVFLNQSGRVAEATGSCVLMVRGDEIITPPHTEGALESITVDLVELIAESMNIKFVRRPIDRTELFIADEIAICGTLAEIVPAKMIENFPLNPDGGILAQIRERFVKIVRGDERHPDIALTPLPRHEKT
jgi:branched-chain amino acid aminotransferase